VVAQPVVRETYVPAQYDVYIAAVSDRDVMYVNGSTYIWFTGSDGRRHRQFYAHGDRRQDVYRRRAHLHEVMVHHNGHLPDRYARDEHRREVAVHGAHHEAHRDVHREAVAMRDHDHQRPSGQRDAGHGHGHEAGPHQVAQRPQHPQHNDHGHPVHEAAGNRPGTDHDARKS
jgi:hypothetical protein